MLKKASAVPLTVLFKYYGIRINELNRKITCPFKSHKGGRENSASFNYYPESNTFHCFGCKAGPSAVDFVSNMEEISRYQAAIKILDIFSSDLDEDILIEQASFSQKLELLLEFSSLAKEFREQHQSEKSFIFIENICSVFDSLNIKLKPNNEALVLIIKQLKERIISYHE